MTCENLRTGLLCRCHMCIETKHLSALGVHIPGKKGGGDTEKDSMSLSLPLSLSNA